MRSRQGITLLELIIAIAIFSVVMVLVTVGITSVLRSQGVNEAATSSQAKLRRVTEVFTQELRSAVLGGVTNQPYQPDDTTISFMLLSGGAGYQVVQTSGFASQYSTHVVASVNDPADLGLAGGQALLVNTNQVGVIVDVTSVTQVGGTGSGGVEFVVNHPACQNTIGFNTDTLLFQVQTLGFQYDPDTKTLYQKAGGGARLPVAFDLDTFRLDYVYTKDSDGTPVVRSAPKTDGSNAPLKESTIGGDDVTLSRIQLVVGADVPSGGGRTVNRTYSGLVELPDNQNFTIKKVKTCNN